MKEAQELIQKELDNVIKRKDIYLYDMDKYGENYYNKIMINELSACERMLERLIKKIIKLRMKEINKK